MSREVKAKVNLLAEKNKLVIVGGHKRQVEFNHIP